MLTKDQGTVPGGDSPHLNSQVGGEGALQVFLVLSAKLFHSGLGLLFPLRPVHLSISHDRVRLPLGGLIAS